MINHNTIKVLLCAITACTALTACQTTQSSSAPPTLNNSDTYIALNERGAVNLTNGDYKKAVLSFKNSLKSNPENNEARLGLAESYLKLKEYHDALNHYQHLLSIPEYKSLALQGIGLAELQKGNILAAKESLVLAVTEDPNLWRSWNALGQSYDYDRNWNESEKSYRQALQIAPEHQHIIHNNLGVSYLAQKRKKEALNEFEQAIQYDPKSESAKTNYRLALATQNRFNEAVLENDVHEEAKALNNVGYAAMLQGRYDEAERLFLKSLEVSPNFYKVPYNNLQVLHELRRN